MKRIAFLLFAASLACLPGCRRGEPTPVAKASPAAPTVQPGPAPISPATPVPTEPPATSKPKSGNFEVPKTSSAGWVTGQLSPDQIAARADAAMHAAKGVMGETDLKLKDFAGKGEFRNKLEIANETHYRIEYLDMKGGIPAKHLAVADGRIRAVLVPNMPNLVSGWRHKGPVTTKHPIEAGTALADSWTLNFPKLMLSGWTEGGGDVFTAYVGSLRKAGFAPRSESRTLNFQGHTIVSHRILAEHKDASGKAVSVELVFDDQFRFPVTVRTSVKPAKGVASDLMWSGRWAFNQKMNPDAFRLPTKF
ncbi:MAG: hypothetical protein HYR64_09525 [Fimbriimonas ginsengisoli]|uniref:Uncharacterized protein n=1 Tax=Fimbriimonas ginsengisoli TaxID=1005039 RepID=A0A931M1N4_FIMGI|nr:hypothetical protein [Fimbriimonas ginsengisoli]